MPESPDRSSTERTWTLHSASIHETVRARTADEAIETLRDRPVEDFAFVVSAVPDGNEDEMELAGTGVLLKHWGRHDDADRVYQAAREAGYLA